jgi:hypothetical protein
MFSAAVAEHPRNPQIQKLMKKIAILLGVIAAATAS